MNIEQTDRKTTYLIFRMQALYAQLGCVPISGICNEEGNPHERMMRRGRHPDEGTPTLPASEWLGALVALFVTHTCVAVTDEVLPAAAGQPGRRYPMVAPGGGHSTRTDGSLVFLLLHPTDDLIAAEVIALEARLCRPPRTCCAVRASAPSQIPGSFGGSGTGMHTATNWSVRPARRSGADRATALKSPLSAGLRPRRPRS